MEYLCKLLPKNTTFLPNLFPISMIDFNLAMWEENVVTINALPLLLTPRRTSSSICLATASEGVFDGTVALVESAIKALTPILPHSSNRLVLGFGPKVGE